METLFPDLLRAVVTDVRMVLLLATMATPKYKSKSVYIIATTIILVANVGANSYFYLVKNYTAVFYVDLVMLMVIGIALKPLFSDKIMQWCFSYITLMNIDEAVVFLSYIFSDIFPNPVYGNVFLRLILFSVIVLVFHKWVSKLYRSVLDYWYIYMLPIVMLQVCFLGNLFGGDIEEMLVNNYMPAVLQVITMTITSTSSTVTASAV